MEFCGGSSRENPRYQPVCRYRVQRLDCAGGKGVVSSRCVKADKPWIHSF